MSFGCFFSLYRAARLAATGKMRAFAARVLRFLAQAILLVIAGTAFAAEPGSKPRAVLELFTSQGCSSCPAADALFVEMARDPGLMVLTFPVDYWDYLGWKDTLAQPAFSQRQRAYAKMRGDGQIYTPQAVIDGATHAVGSDRRALEDAMAAHRQAGPLPLDVTVRAERDQFLVIVKGAAASGSIWVLPIAASRHVAVQRGENKGREIAYANVVRGMMRVGDWRGEPMSLSLPKTLVRHADADGFVVLVQGDEGKIGRILGAAEGPKP